MAFSLLVFFICPLSLHQCFPLLSPDKVSLLFYHFPFFIAPVSYCLLDKPFPHLQVAQAMEQGTVRVLRWRMLLDKVPAKLLQEIQLSACWLLRSLLGAVVCITGNFLLMQALGKYIHVPERKF